MAGMVVARIDLTKLEQLQREMEPRAEAILDDAAARVETAAAQNAPVLTGALRNSIHIEKDKLYRAVMDGVEYGIYQELGTSRMGAQPFMVPALESIRGWFEKAWEALFK